MGWFSSGLNSIRSSVGHVASVITSDVTKVANAGHKVYNHVASSVGHVNNTVVNDVKVLGNAGHTVFNTVTSNVGSGLKAVANEGHVIYENQIVPRVTAGFNAGVEATKKGASFLYGNTGLGQLTGLIEGGGLGGSLLGSGGGIGWENSALIILVVLVGAFLAGKFFL